MTTELDEKAAGLTRAWRLPVGPHGTAVDGKPVRYVPVCTGGD